MNDLKLICVTEWDGVHVWVDAVGKVPADFLVDLHFRHDGGSSVVIAPSCELPLMLTAPFERFRLRWSRTALPGMGPWDVEEARIDVASVIHFVPTADPGEESPCRPGDHLVGVSDGHAVCFRVVESSPREIRAVAVERTPRHVIQRPSQVEVTIGGIVWWNLNATAHPYQVVEDSDEILRCTDLPREQGQPIRVAITPPEPLADES